MSYEVWGDDDDDGMDPVREAHEKYLLEEGWLDAVEADKLRAELAELRAQLAAAHKGGEGFVVDEETLLDAAHILLCCGSPGWARVREDAAHAVGNRLAAAMGDEEAIALIGSTAPDADVGGAG